MSRYGRKRFRFPEFINFRIIEDILRVIIDFIYDLVVKIKNSREILFGICAGVLVAFIVILIIDFRNVRALASFHPNVTTKIYDKNDVLISELFSQKRDIVPFEKIPKHLVQAIVSIEDNEFYDHLGINPKGIVRAFFVNISSGRIRQGGSTITQQLSKILLTSGQRNIFRKIKEAFISIMIEFSYSKDEIINLYLNEIFLGHGSYGVEAASKLYFNKHVSDLDLAEASLLATLPSAPNMFSPIRHPKRSMQRHRVVLSKMVELGYIKPEEAEKAYIEFWPNFLYRIADLEPTINAWSSRVDNAPWFTEYIRRDLIKKYGKETVYEKGLLVYTTLDLTKQMAGQKILKNSLAKQTSVSAGLLFKNEDAVVDNYSELVYFFADIFDMPKFRKKGNLENERVNHFVRNSMIEELEGINYFAGTDILSKFIDKYRKSFMQDKDQQPVEGAIISINQSNGYIEAMVGGSDFSSLNQLNRTMQSRRQAGSAIKPLLYSAAMESGKFTPATAVLDSPIVYLDREGGDWLPENYEGEFYGSLRLRKALALSINVISVRIAEKLGLDYVVRFYSKLLKIDPKTDQARIRRDLSIALGSIEVSPFELTRAYAIIANGGKDVIPFSIRYIKNREGKIIENREEEIHAQIEKRTKEGTLQIIKPETAQIMISMLRTVIEGGTGGGASLGRPAAGKTGTTNNWKDGWFVGFTPQVTTGIWVGYDKLGLSLGIGQSGGGVAAPIWGEYMGKAMEQYPVTDFPAYAGLSGLEVCEKSGLLPSSKCKIFREAFIPGTEPKDTCDICTDEQASQGRAAKRGPKENISRKQKDSILRNFKNKKSDPVINDSGNDLLDKR